MSDFSYSVVRGFGLHIWWITSRHVILHLDRIPRSGAAVLACSHLSPFDVFVLIGASPRHLDFLSIVDFLKMRFVGRFYTAMNCVFVDRGRTDVAATHKLVGALRRGESLRCFRKG